MFRQCCKRGTGKNNAVPAGGMILEKLMKAFQAAGSTAFNFDGLNAVIEFDQVINLGGAVPGLAFPPMGFMAGKRGGKFLADKLLGK